MDRRTDGLTKRGVESRSTRLKIPDCAKEEIHQINFLRCEVEINFFFPFSFPGDFTKLSNFLGGNIHFLIFKTKEEQTFLFQIAPTRGFYDQQFLNFVAFFAFFLKTGSQVSSCSFKLRNVQSDNCECQLQIQCTFWLKKPASLPTKPKNFDKTDQKLVKKWIIIQI